MNEKNYRKRLDFQNQVIAHQSKQIDVLKLKINRLEQKLKEKDEIINSVESMRNEMMDSIKEQRRLKNEYEKLIRELVKMKEIINTAAYNGRWRLVKFLVK